MTRKVTLTVSDALAERIDRFRDRLNQSAIFAAAIDKEIRQMEVPTVKGDLAGVVERLRQQRDTAREEWHAHGVEDGTGYAREQADFTELYQLRTLADSSDWARMEPYYRLGSLAQEYGHEILSDYKREGEPILYNEYWAGFCDGMLSVWNAVKAQL